MSEARIVRNPILPGFNPDPSAVRVGQEYFVATSTFEWFPGVAIYRSTNLADWALAARPLDRTSQLDMRGNPSSGGVWAPSLSYRDGLFWLVYTDMKNLYAPAKDLRNYLVTAPSVYGPWSEPVFLNASGFDPGLFHDEDGRKWLLNLNWDFRPGHNRFGGIVIQAYDPALGALVGPVKTIYPAKGLREGSNLYKKDGWYYLLVAEGGTGCEHAATMARSRSLFGPYEDDPEPLFLSSRFDPTHPLQKAGHASIVEDADGSWWLFHLAGRPIPSQGKYSLGRETCLQAVAWNDSGWLRLAGGSSRAPRDDGDILPAESVEVPCKSELVLRAGEVPAAGDQEEGFDAPVLDPRFLSLRVPLGQESLSLSERPGWLRLKGQESLASKFRQSLVSRRWQSFRFTASTRIDAAPEDFHHLAGLVCLYDTDNWYYLALTHDDALGGPCLKVLASDNGAWTEEAAIAVPSGALELRVDVDWDRLHFSWAPAPSDALGAEASAPDPAWKRLGRDLDASKLSDEYCREGWFTGAMVGLCCQDLSGRARHADFDFFSYKERAK
jgi:xylan 1,4-beta-xylosidase